MRTESPDREPVRTARREWVTTVAPAILAAAVGATAPVHPTAVVWVDVTLAAAFAGLLSLGFARAQRWTWFIPVTVAGAAGTAPWMVAGLLALALTIWASWLPRPRPWMGPVAGGLAAQSLLRLPDWEPFGLSAAVVAVAVLPVALSALLAVSDRVRRRLVTGLAAVGVAVGAMAALAGVIVLGQRSAVESGIDAAESGLSAAQAGEDDRAVQLLSDAADQFEAAADAFGAPWLAPARAIPVLGQHVAALDAVSGQGAALAHLAEDAVVEADLDTLQFDDGVIDIDRLRDLEDPLARSAVGLADATAVVDGLPTEWLVDPVQSRVERFEGQVSDAADDADVALEALRVAPGLFGGEGDRRYFVLFTTPAESRGLGGFVGNYGELTAVDGDLELTRSGRLAEELGPPFGTDPYTISGPQDYLDHYNRFQPDVFIQDTTFSPDFPTVAQVWEELYPQVPGGGELDGVIMVDPFGLAGLLEFTGPITVTGRAEPLTADNAAAFLLEEQYLVFPEDNVERVDYLDEASRLTFEALTSGDIPGPQAVIDVLGPLVAGGHLAVQSTHEAEEALFERTGIDGAVPAVVGDVAGLTGQNSGNSKIDIFSRRAIDYVATVDPDTGWVDATVTIELANDAPPAGLPEIVLNNALPGRLPGTNTTYFTWYSALRLESMTVQDFPAPFETYEELGRNAYSRRIDVPAGEAYTVVLELAGPYDGAEQFRLDLAAQPMVNDDVVSVSIEAADGWRVAGVGGAGASDGPRAVVASRPLGEDLAVIVDFERTG